MIEMKEANDSYYFYLSDGTRIPRSFTLLTGFDKADLFCFILNNTAGLEDKLSIMIKEYEEKRQWNFEHEGQGKNWPIFSRLEHYLNTLQKQAGITDT